MQAVAHCHRSKKCNKVIQNSCQHAPCRQTMPSIAIPETPRALEEGWQPAQLHSRGTELLYLWCDANQEEKWKMNSLKLPCVSLQRKVLPRLTCVWVRMSAYRKREKVFTDQRLLLCKSCTEFHKTVQVDLPKAPACDEDCLESTVLWVLGMGPVATAGMMQELVRL